MSKYYFFQICRELNAQNELRTVVHALPGQTTYMDFRHRSEPVDTSLKVQFPNSENRKVVRLNRGDIIGVLHEGEARAAKLTKYSRNEVYFYRTEREVFFVEGAGNLEAAEINRADEQMLQAYRELRQAGAPETTQDTTSNTASESSEAQQETNVHEMPTQSRINMAELDSIKSHFVETLDMDERQALGKLLMISQMRDRMRLGVAKFSYMKQNGDIRVAYGTRNPDIIRNYSSETREAEGASAGSDAAHFNYFDIQRRAWRRFCTEEIRSVSSSDPITNPEDIHVLAMSDVA